MLAAWFRIFALVLLLSSGSSARADGLEADHRADFLVFGDYRFLNQSGIYNVDAFADGTFVAGDRLRVRYETMQLDVQPEVRGLVSQSLTLPPGDPARLTVQAPRRLVNLDTRFASSPQSEWYFDVERLKFSLSEENFEVYAGRLPVSLGVLRYLPVWNKFTQPAQTTLGAPLVYSQDAAGARLQLGKVAIQALDIEGPTLSDAVRLGELVWYAPSVEFHVLGSYWWNQWTIGGALSADLGPFILKAEGLGIGAGMNDSDHEIQAGAALEWAAASRWTLVLEGLYQSRGVIDKTAYSPTPPTRFMQLQGAGYGLGALQFQATDLWKLSALGLVNLIDGSVLAIPSTDYSLASNLDVTVTGMVPVGASRAEFSRDTYLVSSGKGQGFPYQVSGALRFYF